MRGSVVPDGYTLLSHRNFGIVGGVFFFGGLAVGLISGRVGAGNSLAIGVSLAIACLILGAIVGMAFSK